MLNFSSIIGQIAPLKTAFKDVLLDAFRFNRGSLVILVVFSLALGLMPYAVNGSQALLVNHLTRVLTAKESEQVIFASIVLFAGAYFLNASVGLAARYYTKLLWMTRQQHYDLALLNKYASLDVATHEDPAFQDAATLLQEQGAARTVANFLQSIIRNIKNFVTLVAASITVLAIDWRYFAIILAAVIPQVWVELRYSNDSWSIHVSQSPDRRVFQEVASHIRRPKGMQEVQLLGIGGYFVRRLQGLLENFITAERTQERKRFWLTLGAELLGATVFVGVVFLLVMRIAHGGMQIGTFMFVISAVLLLESSLTNFLMEAAEQQSDSRLVEAYFAILRREPMVKVAPSPHLLSVTRAPEIEFRNVSFAYPNNPGELILRNLSLTIPSGERLALVGINGAGKSTLIKLLSRFYDPTEGSILIDGIDLRDLDLKNWHRHLALLSQDYEKYQFEAWENIALGRYDETHDHATPAVQKAAQNADASRFIEAWGNRYRQQFGKEFAGGVDPSGGQWQKIALARTWFRDGFVTVLDEPTAHVDAAAEAEIFDHLLSKLSEEQTLLLISHRFSTVRRADRICVLKDGCVAELGSHLELVSQNGIYAGLYEKQAKGYR